MKSLILVLASVTTSCGAEEHEASTSDRVSAMTIHEFEGQTHFNEERTKVLKKTPCGESIIFQVVIEEH